MSNQTEGLGNERPRIRINKDKKDVENDGKLRRHILPWLHVGYKVANQPFEETGYVEFVLSFDVLIRSFVNFRGVFLPRINVECSWPKLLPELLDVIVGITAIIGNSEPYCRVSVSSKATEAVELT